MELNVIIFAIKDGAFYLLKETESVECKIQLSIELYAFGHAELT